MLSPETDRILRPAQNDRGTLILVGLSHHTAPVAVRERLAGGDAAARAEALREAAGPAVVLSTCNRLEVYAWAAGAPARRAAAIVRRLAALGAAALGAQMYQRRGVEAIHHLIRVAAGLDSLALGESQILGQVRAAWLGSREALAVAPPAARAQLELVFRRAIEAGRAIRAGGAFDRHPSVAAIAVHAAAHPLGGLSGRRAAVVGAGLTGKAAAAALAAAGAAHVTLVNRTPQRALAAAQALRLGERLSLAGPEALPQVLREVDVLISATAAPSPVVPAALVAAALAGRGARPLVLVDIAVPRDVDPAVRHLRGVRLLDLDDLEAGCALDAPARQAELARAEALAREAADACQRALRQRGAAAEIVALRRRAEAIRQAELRRLAARLERLAPADRAAVEQLTHTIVQKLLHAPTVALRAAAADPAPRARGRRADILAALTGGGSRERAPIEIPDRHA